MDECCGVESTVEGALKMTTCSRHSATRPLDAMQEFSITLTRYRVYSAEHWKVNEIDSESKIRGEGKEGRSKEEERETYWLLCR